MLSQQAYVTNNFWSLRWARTNITTGRGKYGHRMHVGCVVMEPGFAQNYNRLCSSTSLNMSTIKPSAAYYMAWNKLGWVAHVATSRKAAWRIKYVYSNYHTFYLSALDRFSNDL